LIAFSKTSAVCLISLALTLDTDYSIAVRSGHHCALPLIKELLKLKIGSVRASTYLYNTLDEINSLLNAIEDIANL